MNIETLEEFCSVVRHQNITKAADALFMSQSTLSRHLLELEEELGTRLIERDNRAFRLTPAGMYFDQEIRKVLNELERIQRKTSQLGNGYEGTLRFFSFCSSVPFIFEEILAFRRENPEIVCSIDYQHRVIPTLLEGGDADLGIGFSFELPQNGGLSYQEIGTSELCLILPPDHRLSTQGSVALSELHGECLLLFEDQHYAFIDALVERFLACDEGNRTVQVQNPETMILHSRLGEGIGLLPRLLAQERAAGCSLVGIEDPLCQISLCLCWKPDNDNPALARFLDHLSQRQDGLV